MDAVATVLDREFPDRTVAESAPAARGNRKETRQVRFADGGGVVVQLSERPDALSVEAALARAVRERTPVPVPAVLATGRVDALGYVVAERAAGDDLHERFVSLPDDERAAVARAFGRWLAACHDAFAFGGYGPLELADGDLVATAPDWSAWFRGYLDAGVDALPEAFDDLRGPIRSLAADAALPDAPPARLFPWDLRPGNALYDDGVTAVLDWGEPLAAGPALSVAKTEHLVCDWYGDDRERLRTVFRSGYETVRPWPDPAPVHRVAAVVRSAVDSTGTVTRPDYPEREGEAALAFHRERLRALL
ncbi:phosphotransferase family protein [Halosegnis marinus]|uniref:phosphotransferase family protein n=1 Tax=Halosegnis marinus TaxID=3034023 RepID=UPI00360DD6D9